MEGLRTKSYQTLGPPGESKSSFFSRPAGFDDTRRDTWYNKGIPPPFGYATRRVDKRNQDVAVVSGNQLKDQLPLVFWDSVKHVNGVLASWSPLVACQYWNLHHGKEVTANVTHSPTRSFYQNSANLSCHYNPFSPNRSTHTF